MTVLEKDQVCGPELQPFVKSIPVVAGEISALGSKKVHLILYSVIYPFPTSSFCLFYTV